MLPGINEAKGHHYEFVMSVLGTKGSLKYVFVLDSELVVLRTKVYLGKSPRAS